MNRTKQREQAFILIFQSQFQTVSDEDIELYGEYEQPVGEYARQLFDGVTKTQNELDEIILNYSNGWKIARLPKVNVSILRLAVYEIKYVDSVPASVAINEAVELAKKYSGSEDYSFINGILGSYVRSGC